MKTSRNKTILAGLAAIGLSLAAARAGAAPEADQTRGVAAELAFQSSDFMRRTAFRNPANYGTDDAPDGAYGPLNRAWDATHTGKWYIEEQRTGGDIVCAGIVAQNKDVIDRGLRVLNWGWQQQQPDGSFACEDNFHSTSFFVEATAHACLMLVASRYAADYASQIAQVKTELHKAALWMVSPEIEGPGKRHNLPYTHRRYLVGCALGETGVLCEDANLVTHSRDYILDGISLQDPAGFNPERGGYDSSYHAFGTLLAERYYVLVAGDSLRAPLYAMIAKAVAWEGTRINPDGTINTEGNSRVDGVGNERNRAGVAKKPAVTSIFECFDYWSRLSGDHGYEDLAAKVAGAARMLRRQVPVQ